MSVLTFDDVIVSAVCSEPEGEITREIRQMALTPDNLKTFWDKARVFTTLFTEDIRNDFKRFLEVFLRTQPDGGVEAMGLFWVLDDFIGVYYMTELRAGIDAQVHYTFFDRRHNGRVLISRELMRYVMQKYQFHRLSAAIPLYNKQALKFVEDVGFVKEGRKRQATLHGNDWMDVNLYGILNTEV
jgi:RimJ/RimL family protein N-acetyltransferase